MQIHINKPCTEQWSNMADTKNGKYCHKCCKTVIDFTDWEANAIADYLKQHISEEVCGRIKTEILTIPTTRKAVSIFRIWSRGIGLANKIAAFILLAAGFAATGCKEESQPISEHEDSLKSIGDDSLKWYKLGMMELDIPDSSYRLTNTDSTSSKS